MDRPFRVNVHEGKCLYLLYIETYFSTHEVWESERENEKPYSLIRGTQVDEYITCLWFHLRISGDSFPLYKSQAEETFPLLTLFDESSELESGSTHTHCMYHNKEGKKKKINVRMLQHPILYFTFTFFRTIKVHLDETSAWFNILSKLYFQGFSACIVISMVMSLLLYLLLTWILDWFLSLRILWILMYSKKQKR